jgi:arginine/lysine/ornithine decarboxylase
MASLDGARKILATRGKEIFDKALHIARYARDEINKIPHFYAFGKELIDGKGVFNYDETKLSINTSQLGITGLEVYDILRNEYMIQMELADVHNVMAVISLGDNIENVEALIAALKDISAKYKKDKVIKNTVVLETPEVVVPPREAFYKQRSSMPIEESEGKISGEFFMVYPPGIPILTPGERITKEILKYIRILKEEKAVFTDNSDPEIKTIMVID